MFRFTIRDVLWGTLVAALSVGWFRDHVSQQVRQTEANRMHQQDLRQLRVEIDSLSDQLYVCEFRRKHGVDPPP